MMSRSSQSYSLYTRVARTISSLSKASASETCLQSGAVHSKRKQTHRIEADCTLFLTNTSAKQHLGTERTSVSHGTGYVLLISGTSMMQVGTLLSHTCLHGVCKSQTCSALRIQTCCLLSLHGLQHRSNLYTDDFLAGCITCITRNSRKTGAM